MIERQPMEEEIAKLPFAKNMLFNGYGEWWIINREIGIACSERHSNFVIMCDKRIRVQRTGNEKQPGDTAEIGHLTISIGPVKKLFIGNESPLVLMRLARRNYLKIIQVRHTEDILLERTELDMEQVIQRLEASLVS